MVMAPIDIRPQPIPRCPHPPIGPGPIHPGPIRPLPGKQEWLDQFVFSQKDKDKDGNLSLDEWVKSDKDVTMADIEKFKRYDRDDDGQVSRAEFLAGRKWDRMIGEWFKKGYQGLQDGIKPLAELVSKKEAAPAEK